MEGLMMEGIPGEIGAWLDILLETVPTILIAIATLIIGYILAYVAGQMVREICCHFSGGRPTDIPGPRSSVIAGKIAKAMVFAIAAIISIQMVTDGGLFRDGEALVEDYAVRMVLGLLTMFVGAFLADIASSSIARWLRGGICLPEETDPPRDLVFLGLLVSVVLVGLGIMLLNNLVALLVFLAVLVIGVLTILLETRRKMCRKV